jgi:hypothetical protein
VLFAGAKVGKNNVTQKKYPEQGIFLLSLRLKFLGK